MKKLASIKKWQVLRVIGLLAVGMVAATAIAGTLVSNQASVHGDDAGQRQHCAKGANGQDQNPGPSNENVKCTPLAPLPGGNDGNDVPDQSGVGTSDPLRQGLTTVDFGSSPVGPITNISGFSGDFLGTEYSSLGLVFTAESGHILNIGCGGGPGDPNNCLGADAVQDDDFAGTVFATFNLGGVDQVTDEVIIPYVNPTSPPTRTIIRDAVGAVLLDQEAGDVNFSASGIASVEMRFTFDAARTFSFGTLSPSSADLFITKTASPGVVSVSEELTYTVVVTGGDADLDTATNVVLTDELPVEVSYVSATPTQGECSEDDGVVTCDLGSIEPGASATVDIVVTPLVVGEITNTASVSSDILGPDTIEASATPTVQETCRLELSLSYAASTLTVELEFGTRVPTTRTTWWLNDSGEMIVIDSAEVPAGDSFETVVFEVPDVPQQQTVGVVSAMTILGVGGVCNDTASIFTVP